MQLDLPPREREPNHSGCCDVPTVCFRQPIINVYQQHCCGLAKMGHSECPRKAILIDLESELVSWQEAGDSIIVLTDFNEDVWLPWIWQFFANINLIEATTALTGPSGTATYNCGTTLIDRIYVSLALLLLINGGYLAFDAGIPSNHWALWIDVPGIILGLDDNYTPRQPSAWRLHCRDPWVVKNIYKAYPHS